MYDFSPLYFTEIYCKAQFMACSREILLTLEENVDAFVAVFWTSVEWVELWSRPLCLTNGTAAAFTLHGLSLTETGPVTAPPQLHVSLLLSLWVCASGA